VNRNSQYRVLVVDDEYSVLTTYRMILEREGYTVTACRNSRDAIAAVERDTFDVLLCDYSLEEQHTGFEVITAARKRNSEVPAALLTGYATLETVDEAQLSNIAVLFKPIEIAEFLATTSKLLRRDHESDQKDNREETAQSQGNAQDGWGRDRGARHRSSTRSIKD